MNTNAVVIVFSVKEIGLAAGYVILLTDVASPKPLAMGFGWVTKITEKSLV